MRQSQLAGCACRGGRDAKDAGEIVAQTLAQIERRSGRPVLQPSGNRTGPRPRRRNPGQEVASEARNEQNPTPAGVTRTVAFFTSDDSGFTTGHSIPVNGGELDYTQKVESLQVEHEDVKAVKAGDDFGTKVKKKVHEG